MAEGTSLLNNKQGTGEAFSEAPPCRINVFIINFFLLRSHATFYLLIVDDKAEWWTRQPLSWAVQVLVPIQ